MQEGGKQARETIAYLFHDRCSFPRCLIKERLCECLEENFVVLSINRSPISEFNIRKNAPATINKVTDIINANETERNVLFRCFPVLETWTLLKYFTSQRMKISDILPWNEAFGSNKINKKNGKCPRGSTQAKIFMKSQWLWPNLLFWRWWFTESKREILDAVK